MQQLTTDNHPSVGGPLARRPWAQNERNMKTSRLIQIMAALAATVLLPQNLTAQPSTTGRPSMSAGTPMHAMTVDPFGIIYVAGTAYIDANTTVSFARAPMAVQPCDDR